MSELSHDTDGSENTRQEISLEEMPSILETVPPPPEHQFIEPGEQAPRRKTVRLAAAGGILAVGVGVGILLAGGDSTESTRSVLAEENPETDTVPSTAEATTPETTVVTVTETLPEPVTSPVLMESFEPQELLDQLVSNIHCMFGENPMRTQEACLSYVVGDGSGSLSAMFSNLIIEYNDYRIEDPEFEYDYTAELLDARIDNYQAVILAQVEDPASTYTNRYTFRRSLANIIQPDIEDQSRTVWILQKTEVLEPGEMSFE